MTNESTADRRRRILRELVEADKRELGREFRLLTTDQQDFVRHPGLPLAGGHLEVDRRDIYALANDGLLFLTRSDGGDGGVFDVTPAGEMANRKAVEPEA